MPSSDAMRVLLKQPGANFDTTVAPYQDHLARYVDVMQQSVDAGSQLASMAVFRDYVRYCRWPIRQLEYSFVISHVPGNITSHALDVGSGVTPWPYFLAERGWPTISIDPEADQVAAMKQHGQSLFGAFVDHHVADARGVGFATGKFGLITCISVLEHLAHADVPFALAEMVRMCHPGGRIIVTTDIYAADDTSIPQGSGAFSATTIDRIFGPVARACGAEAPFTLLTEQLRGISLQDLELFWTQHWQPGLWEERNRGYGAVGMVFDLPASAEACRALVDELRQVARQMDYPPPGSPFHQVQSPDGTALWLIDDEVMTHEIMSGEFEHDIHEFFEHYIQPDDIIFDVGANVGLYTLLFARLVANGGQVHAFEPTAQVFSCLVHNTLSTDAQIRLNRMGLSHENGPQRLFLGDRGNSCFNSFGEPIAAGSSEQGRYESELVWTSTLDTYMRDFEVARVDLLKIDVEGWEERVLRGGIETLLSYSPVLVVEFCSPAARNAHGSCSAIAHLLQALDYQLFRYVPADRTLDPVDVDRDTWEYANLIGVKRSALASVLARLAKFSSGGSTWQSTGAAPGQQNAHDQLLLLEENRALRRRLMSGILDQEVMTLYQKLQASESDRAARLKAIEHLKQQTIQLQEQLKTSEADRAARLEVIRRQSTESQATVAQLQQQIAQQQQQIGALQQQLAHIEQERSVERAQLAGLSNHPIIRLQRKFKRAK